MELPEEQAEEGQRMRPIRISTLLFRRIHKWVGLILGLQFLLWTVSGAVMALIDHHDVSGEHLGHPPQVAPWPEQALSPSDLSARLGTEIVGFTFRPMLGQHVYEVATPKGIRVLDENGRQFVVDAAVAKAIASADYAGKAAVARVSLLSKPILETRDHDEPLWRVDFADNGDTSFYVSQATGKVVERRDDSYRLWDFFWMLHNMDYVERKSFNHSLIIMVAFGMLWLSGTGFYLLFKSFKRSDFRWIPGVLPRSPSNRLPAE
ncbi:MAG: PepSY domain-containing protein [Sphingomonadaceae bacterium]|nr:PepSY domain-containing protein [Sphingomonadaceae bacterium]